MIETPYNFVELRPRSIKLESKRRNALDNTEQLHKGMPLFLYTNHLSTATVILKAEGAIRTDNRLADSRKALLIVKYSTVTGVRSVGCRNFRIKPGGLVSTDGQITAIDEFQLDLPTESSLNHLAFADGVAALQTAQLAAGIASERLTSNSSNAGDDFSHNTAPALF